MSLYLFIYLNKFWYAFVVWRAPGSSSKRHKWGDISNNVEIPIKCYLLLYNYRSQQPQKKHLFSADFIHVLFNASFHYINLSFIMFVTFAMVVTCHCSSNKWEFLKQYFSPSLKWSPWRYQTQETTYSLIQFLWCSGKNENRRLEKK